MMMFCNRILSVLCVGSSMNAPTSQVLQQSLLADTLYHSPKCDYFSKIRNTIKIKKVKKETNKPILKGVFHHVVSLWEAVTSMINIMFSM